MSISQKEGLTFRFSSRLRAREAVRLLFVNGEEDIRVFVWPVSSDKRHVTVNVIPRDMDFCRRILSTHGVKSSVTREELLERGGSALETYQQDSVMQFPAWRRK